MRRSVSETDPDEQTSVVRALLPFCILSCAGLVLGFFFLADSSSFFIDQILIMVAGV